MSSGGPLPPGLVFRALVRMVLVTAVVAGMPGQAAAQVASAEITGSVKDPAGASVPGATLTVIDTATSQTRVVVSTGDGIYAAPGLVPGSYNIEVELIGFNTIRREGVRVATGEKLRLDFELTVGDVRE